MRRESLMGLVVAVLMFLVVSAGYAQPWKGWRGSDGWGMGTSYQRMYNPATVETVSVHFRKNEKGSEFLKTVNLQWR